MDLCSLLLRFACKVVGLGWEGREWLQSSAWPERDGSEHEIDSQVLGRKIVLCDPRQSETPGGPGRQHATTVTG